MNGSLSWKVSVSIAENIMLKRVGASTQPWFTPLVTGNGAEDSSSVVQDVGLHAIVELSHLQDESVRAPELAHHFLEPLTTVSVKGLGKVDKGRVQVDIFFLTFFLQLPGSKHHVSGSPFLPEATLVFW